MEPTKEMNAIHAQVMALEVETAKQKQVIAAAGMAIAGLDVQRAVLFEKLDQLRMSTRDLNPAE